MATKLKSEEKAKRDMVLHDHAKLKQEVAEIGAKRTYISGVMSNPIFSNILAKFEKEIESKKESLVEAEKKDVEKIQAEVQARRALIATLKGAYDADHMDACERLRRFEKDNDLLLSAAQANAENADEHGEVISA